MPAFVGARRKLRLGKDPSILLNEPFDGGSLSPRKWPSIVDTGGNISVSGGELIFAGGANNWTGTRITSPPLAVVAGLRLDWDMIWSNRGGGGTDMGFDATSPVAQALVPGFLQQITLYANRDPATAAVALPLTIALNTRYYFCIICLNPGALWYVATSPYGPWALMWYRPTGYTGTLYAGITNYDAVGKCSAMVARRGLVPGPLVSVASPTMPTPQVGADVIVNGAFAADTDWTKGAGWAIAAGVAAATAADTDLSQTVNPLTANTWYYFRYQVTLFTAGTITPKFGTTAGIARSSAGTFEEMQRANDAGFALTGTGLTASIDNVQCYPYTLASLFTLVGDPGVKAGLFDYVIPTLQVGTQAGLAICLDSATAPLYYLLAYHDGTNFHLDKVENGTPTSLINTAQTYNAATVYRILKYGSAIQCYADFTLIGTTQTVNTASGYGTKVATFSTLSTNAVTNVEVRGGRP